MKAMPPPPPPPPPLQPSIQFVDDSSGEKIGRSNAGGSAAAAEEGDEARQAQPQQQRWPIRLAAVLKTASFSLHGRAAEALQAVPFIITSVSTCSSLPP